MTRSHPKYLSRLEDVCFCSLPGEDDSTPDPWQTPAIAARPLQKRGFLFTHLH